jgi:aminopeptidase
VPTGASGQFPLKFEDGTIGLMTVKGGRIVDSSLLKGNQETIDAHKRKLQSDPLTGELGELGFGTQLLPVSGRDIQDEKILGTLHVATGRSDHLGGHLTPDKFVNKKNATHDDILFAPHKTPEINVPQVRMKRNGKVEILIESFQPAPYMADLLA